MDRPDIWLCCFARPSALHAGDGSDEDGAPLVLEVQDVAAFFRSLGSAELTAETLDRNLQDPAWIIPQVLLHEQIIKQVMLHSPVLPVRFGAFFSSLESLEKLLVRRRSMISRFLDDIAGKEEWGVKGFVNVGSACDWLLASEPRFAERHRQLPLPPGARYFQEKKLRAEIEKEAKTWGRALADQIHTELASGAMELRRLRTQGRREPGRELAFHYAVLLPRDSAAGLQDLVSRIGAREARRGLAMEISGPWPPYNFCPAIEEATP